MKQAPKKGTATAAKNAAPAQPTATPLQTASGLQELFTDSIKDMYWCENHLVKSIPKMIAAAGDATLKKALTEHLAVTAQQAANLEQVFELLGEKIQAKKCDACEGLVMSGEHVIENTVAGTEARDTGIIMSALKVENFEITCYNGLIQLATTLGLNEAVNILTENLNGELQADEILTAMSTPGSDTTVAASAGKKTAQ